MRNFRECPKGEVRRITIPRTPVNKAKKKHRSVDKPRSNTCERTGLRSASFGYILTSHNARRRLCPPQAPPGGVECTGVRRAVSDRKGPCLTGKCT